MPIVPILLFVSIIWGYILYGIYGDNPKSRRLYLITMIAVLVAESCLRGLSVGPDTSTYYFYYQEIQTTPWSSIWDDFVVRYTKNEGTFDIGFNVLQKFVQFFSYDFSFFLFISALFFFIPFGILLNRYTKSLSQLIFIFVFYVSLFNMIAMSGVRKEIALGFSIIFLLLYIDKKYILASVFLLIGMTIHLTTLLIVLVPLISSLKGRNIKYIHLSLFLLVPVVIASSNSILIAMADLVSNGKYREYGEAMSAGGATTFVVLIEVLSLLCLIAFWKDDLVDRTKRIFYSTIPLFTFFAPLIVHNGSMIRISQYFHLYLLLMLPFAVEKLFGSSRKIVLAIMILILIVLTVLTSDMSYLFIWQDKNPV